MSTGPNKRQQLVELRSERRYRPRLSGACGQGRCHTCEHEERCGCVCHDLGLAGFPLDDEH